VRPQLTALDEGGVEDHDRVLVRRGRLVADHLVRGQVVHPHGVLP
jgi:hypothetical protein